MSGGKICWLLFWSVIGMGITYALGEIFDRKMETINKSSSQHIKPPKGIDETKWIDAFIIPDELQKNTKWLGFLERFVYLYSIWIMQPTIIGIWLAFKVTSKWETWQHIIRMPDEFCKNQAADNIKDPLDEFKARNIILKNA